MTLDMSGNWLAVEGSLALVVVVVTMRMMMMYYVTSCFSPAQRY